MIQTALGRRLYRRIHEGNRGCHAAWGRAQIVRFGVRSLEACRMSQYSCQCHRRGARSLHSRWHVGTCRSALVRGQAYVEPKSCHAAGCTTNIAGQHAGLPLMCRFGTAGCGSPEVLTSCGPGVWPVVVEIALWRSPATGAARWAGKRSSVHLSHALYLFNRPGYLV